MPRRGTPLLYLMIKLPPPLAASLADWTNRPYGLLHLTLLPLGDLRHIDPRTYAVMIAVLDTLALPSFHVMFDRIVEHDDKAWLRPSEPLRGAKAFQRELVAALIRHGLPVPRYAFSPHVTLRYGGGQLDDVSIDPVSWLVDEFCLVESIFGETRHVERARWRLARTGSAVDRAQPLRGIAASASRARSTIAPAATSVRP